MAEVFTNDMVAHVWAQRNQARGRSHNGQFYFHGPRIYSYGEHFLAAVILDVLAPPVVLIAAESPSVTTSNHLHTIRAATLHMPRVAIPRLQAIRSPLGFIADGAPASVRAHYAKEIRAHLESAPCAALSVGDIALVLRAIGSRASAENVARKARAAAEKARAAAEKAENARLLETAREALAQPLSYFSTFDNVYTGPRMTWPAYATALNRARRAAKAARWGAKRLSALRERETAIRERVRHLDAKANFFNRRASLRRAAASLRELIGDKSPAQAFLDGSNMRRVQVAILLERPCVASAPLMGVPRAVRDAALAEAAERGARERKLHQHIEGRSGVARAEIRLADWQAGRAVTLSWRDAQRGGVLLRAVRVERDESGAITGGVLETSMGASVPLTRAVKVFQFLKLQRERAGRAGFDPFAVIWTRNGERVPVGHFEVNEIRADGSFRAGCHSIGWSEVERLARALGVFELPPSEVATRAA